MLLYLVIYLPYLFSEAQSNLYHVPHAESSGTDLQIEGAGVAAFGEAVVLRDSLQRISSQGEGYHKGTIFLLNNLHLRAH